MCYQTLSPPAWSWGFKIARSVRQTPYLMAPAAKISSDAARPNENGFVPEHRKQTVGPLSNRSAVGTVTCEPRSEWCRCVFGWPLISAWALPSLGTPAVRPIERALRIGPRPTALHSIEARRGNLCFRPRPSALATHGPGMLLNCVHVLHDKPKR
jgi:hypothetical protein